MQVGHAYHASRYLENNMCVFIFVVIENEAIRNVFKVVLLMLLEDLSDFLLRFGEMYIAYLFYLFYFFRGVGGWVLYSLGNVSFFLSSKVINCFDNALFLELSFP